MGQEFELDSDSESESESVSRDDDNSTGRVATNQPRFGRLDCLVGSTKQTYASVIM
jgi:hypothetical protein